MPDAASKFNYVTFEPIGIAEAERPRIYLGDCTIRLAGGLEPQVWTAVVPYTELDKLDLGTTVSGEVQGIVRLWYTNPPHDADGENTPGTDADVSIGLVAIIDIDPAEIGVVAGETTKRVISWNIAIADHRRAWQAPRGGVLLKGLVNPSGVDPDPASTGPLTNSELMDLCATAMGATVFIGSEADDVDPLLDLDWTCAHAPSELQRLLEYTGMVYAPLISGQAQIMKPGTMLPPTIPSDRLVRDVIHGTIDRRSAYVVFTSAPNAKIRSFNDTEGATVPSWKYVMQDPYTGQWRPAYDLDDFSDLEWSNDFYGAGEQLRAHLKSQAYRCIQLDPTKYPPGRVQLLPAYVDKDLAKSPIRLAHEDLLARMGDGSFWKFPNTFVRAEKIVPEHNIIIFEHPLMKVPSGTQTRRMKLGATEVCIPENELKPWFSVEGWDDTTHSREYGVFGATVSLGFVALMSSSTAKSYLTGFRPNVVILNAPDLINVLVNGGATSGDRNTEALEDRVTNYASAALGNSAPAAREIIVKGFYPVELDACVSEVTYDPRSCTTRIMCNTWHCARYGGGR